ncbi:N-acetyltransferase [Raoultella planticola]|nr:N-acetyltransferase [Raoultella planticola]OAZ77655.1 acetyltransferase [Raoultella planticola]OAZ79105.1 acetyltransferase [Raoultella planticola]
MLCQTPVQGMTMIIVEKADPLDAESHRLIEMLSSELAAITGDNGKSHFAIDAINGDNSLWVLARNTRGNAIGCGAIRPVTQHIAELKRMFSDRSEPGVGRALLRFLETSAREMGYSELWLETRLINHKAVRFYEKNGYVRIENYGPYIGRKEAVCFSKALH